MALITKIDQQKNNANKVNIFVDEKFYHGLHIDALVKYSLKQDMEIDLSELDNIILESEKIIAFDKAVDYLGECYKTEKQIRDYLNKKEFSKITVKYVIEKLKEYKYIDDEKYCDWYIRTHRTKYGKNMLKNKLYEKGISKENIENALENFKSNNEEIMNLLSKKIGNKTIDNNLLSKTIRYMCGRGFSYEEVKECINEFKNNNGGEDYDSWN